MAKKKGIEVIDFNIQTGQKLRYLRNNYGTSQKALADYLGITQQNIVRYETGVVSIPFSAIVKICAFFNISTLDYFIEEPQSLNEEIAYYGINIYDYYNPMVLSLLRNFKNLTQEEKEKTEFYEAYYKNPIGIIYLLGFIYYPLDEHWNKRQAALKDIYMSGEKKIIEYLNNNLIKYFETLGINVPKDLGFVGLSFFLLDKLNEIYSNVNFSKTVDYIILNDIIDKAYLLYTHIEKIRLELDCQYKKYTRRFEPYREFITTYKINDENLEFNVKAYKLFHSGKNWGIRGISKMNIEEIFSTPADKFKLECNQSVHGVEIARYQKGNVIVAILTELEENIHGISVTNLFEEIATMVHNDLLKDVNPKNIKWIRHYQKEYTPQDQHPYDEVFLSFKRKSIFSKEIIYHSGFGNQKKIDGIVSVFAETEKYKDYDFTPIKPIKKIKKGNKNDREKSN